MKPGEEVYGWSVNNDMTPKEPVRLIVEDVHKDYLTALTTYVSYIMLPGGDYYKLRTVLSGNESACRIQFIRQNTFLSEHNLKPIYSSMTHIYTYGLTERVLSAWVET